MVVQHLRNITSSLSTGDLIHLEQEGSRCDPRLRPFAVVFASGMDGWRLQTPYSLPMILRESDVNTDVHS